MPVAVWLAAIAAGHQILKEVTLWDRIFAF